MRSRAERSRPFLDEVFPAEHKVDVLLSTGGGFLGDGNTPPVSTQVLLIGDYTYKPSRIFVPHKLCGYISNTQTVNVRTYGDSLLDAGIVLSIKDSSDTIIHMFNPMPIAAVQDWVLILGTSINLTDRIGVVFEWNVTGGSRRLFLRGDRGEYFSLEVRESILGLDDQRFHLHGEFRP